LIIQILLIYRYLIDKAREQVRSSINDSDTNEVIFTSGGTESNKTLRTLNVEEYKID
jgi:cysteine sulfinate desulfinase/cysteine desulfurase-like protein